MNAQTPPPQMDPWASGVRASDVPITEEIAFDDLGAPDPLAPNVAEIRKFLNCIKSGIHLVSIIPDGATSGQYFGDDADAATRWATAQNSAGKGVYFTVNLTKHGLNKKPGKEDIVAARFCHCDIDPPADGRAWDREEVLSKLIRLRAAPSLVVDSGNGFQPLWRLDHAPTEHGPVEGINQSIAKEFDGDSCHNIDRLLRVPGTVNYPNAKKRSKGRLPVMASLAHVASGDGIHRFAELAREFPPIPKEDEGDPQDEFKGDIGLLTPDDLGLSQLSPLRSVIVHPAGKDRSADGLRAAGDMLRAGFTKAQVLGILLNPANRVSAHYLDQADPRRAALRTIEYAGREGRGQNEGQSAKPRFVFETVSDLRSMPDQEYLVDGWIPENSTGLLYGRWGSGKTFIAFDLALHLAFGLPDWHGAKLPGEPCEVLIIAREGHAGFVKRVSAFMQHHGLMEDPKNLVFMRSAISFLDDTGFAALKEAINELNRAFRFVLVDTVGRVLPGADMAKEQPVTLFMERLQQLGDITSGTTLGVHHENKSGDANGSMYFQNNSDFMFQTSREGDGPLERGKITCMKQKEGDDLWSRDIAFAKETLPDGKTTLVVVSVSEGSECSKGKVATSATPKQKRALAALDEVVLSHGEPAPAYLNLAGTKAANVERWKDELFARGVIDGKSKNPRTDFKRIKDGLADRALIGERDGLVWRAKETP